MQERLGIGKYVRTNCGIRKIIDIKVVDEEILYKPDKPIYISEHTLKTQLTKEDIKYSKSDITELLEYGDMVTISNTIYENMPLYILTNTDIEQIRKSLQEGNQLTSIVTQKEFELLKYKVGR